LIIRHFTDEKQKNVELLKHIKRYFAKRTPENIRLVMYRDLSSNLN